METKYPFLIPQDKRHLYRCNRNRVYNNEAKASEKKNGNYPKKS